MALGYLGVSLCCIVSAFVCVFLSGSESLEKWRWQERRPRRQSERRKNKSGKLQRALCEGAGLGVSEFAQHLTPPPPGRLIRGVNTSFNQRLPYQAFHRRPASLAKSDATWQTLCISDLADRYVIKEAALRGMSINSVLSGSTGGFAQGAPRRPGTLLGCSSWRTPVTSEHPVFLISFRAEKIKERWLRESCLGQAKA